MSGARMYLSFVDPTKPEGERWAGAVVVAGSNLIEAVQRAHFLKINPGGEVVGQPVDDELSVPAEFMNRLLDRADVAALDKVLLAQRTKH